MSARKPVSDVAASVRARLRDLARRRGVEVQLVLSEFAVERLLHRLGTSAHAEAFVLKGATLLRTWSGDSRRATWDLDLHGRGPSAVADVVTVVRELCSIRAVDGIHFDADSVAGEEIRLADDYAGVRVRLQARLGEARIPVQVDVGYGDAIVPPPTMLDYPTLLDHESPRVLAYPREAVVAEKLEAMISLGMTNSRMKDFYDLHWFARAMSFDGVTLATAIRATFLRRGTEYADGDPVVLTPGFLADPARAIQWRAFLRRSRLDAPHAVAELTEMLREFLLPVLRGAKDDGRFDADWPAGGPWRTRERSGP